VAIDWDVVIKDAESDLSQRLSSRVVAGIVGAIPWLSGASGPLTFLIGLLIGQLVKYGDWLAYYLGDSWMNTENGKSYQQAGEVLANLPPTATKGEIDAAKKAKADAFDKLMGAG
jgi:hypothetical protein